MGTLQPLVHLTLLASLWYFTAFLVSATARSTKPTDWSMLFSMRSIMVPCGHGVGTAGDRQRKKRDRRRLRAPKGGGTQPPTHLACLALGLESLFGLLVALLDVLGRLRDMLLHVIQQLALVGTAEGTRSAGTPPAAATGGGGTAPRQVAQPRGAGTHPSPVGIVAPRMAWGGTKRG